ncbi:MAG TPA: MarR family winged helix-turn-helix transcriptional regulator [Negativicutes bacterium]
MSYLNLANMQHCACGNLRKTTRALTQFFDQYLQPTGLRSTQCSLLINISLHGNISVGDLGTRLLMDQTTVTRNIEILRKHGYITIIKEENDARKKSISITESGVKKLAEAVPFWEQAQLHIEQGLGAKRLQDFLKTLKEIERLVE